MSRSWRARFTSARRTICVQRITKLRDEHGIGYFGASMSFGQMEHTKVMRSMELFAKEVMPKFRQ